MKSRAERQAINTKIQGSAADFIKMAQVALEGALAGTGVEQVLQVHDELVFYAPNADIAAEMLPRIKAIMENVAKLRVAVTTEPTIVLRWGQAKIKNIKRREFGDDCDR